MAFITNYTLQCLFNDNQHHLENATYSYFLSISPCPAALLTFNEDSPPTGLSSARPFPLEVSFCYASTMRRVKPGHHPFCPPAGF